MMHALPPDPFALPIHGGDPVAAERRFGRPADGWLDLSTGINPYPYPLPDLPAALWQNLPPASAEENLRHIAARAWGVNDAERVIVANGSQSLLQLLPRLRPVGHVSIVGPTYAEHGICWANAGHRVLPCETLDRVGDAEVVVVVNPNNPDGRRFEPARLLDMAETLALRGGLLVVDEAFGEVTPELSLAAHTGPALIVLKSFGKFWGLAGLRLGFAIGEPMLLRAMRQMMGPWTVSGPALAIGSAALADSTWTSATRRRLSREAQGLDGILIQAGLSVIGGTNLFRLVNAPRAWALYEHLGQSGILVRPFAASPRWLRIGLPPGDAGRDRLRAALAAWE